MLTLQVCKSTSLQIYKSASLQVCKSASLQVCRSAGLQVCRSAGLQVCRSAGLQVCRSAGLQVCRSAGLQVCRSASLQVCKSASLQSVSVAHRSPAASKKPSKQYLQYFHQNLRLLDYTKSDVHKHDSVFGLVRYINILTWLRGFRVKIEFFFKFLLSLNSPKET